MVIKINIESLSQMDERFINAGWTCPECYGVRVNLIKNKYDQRARYDSFSCDECGARWGRE